MPNWCSNSMYVWGDRQQVYKFYMDVTTALSDHPNFEPEENDWSRNWIANIFFQAGYTYDEIKSRNFLVRGSIDYVALVTDNMDDLGVRFDEETAWGPNDDAIETLLDEKYPGLQFVFIAEEPGCEVYCNSDSEGRMFLERWAAEWTVDGGDYEGEDYECDKDCAAGLSEILGLSEKEILDFLGSGKHEDLREIFYEKHPGEEAFFSIHKYESC